MARIIDNQINVWGKQDGPDIQRSDLWVIDFNQALSGLAAVAFDGTPMIDGLGVPFLPSKLATYFAYSVVLPELRIRPEVYRRDSRPYNMPGVDEPLDAIRVTFLLDSFKPGGTSISPYRSDIYQMLDVWRAVVRAGRGAMSGEFAITLDGNYRIDFAYDVRVLLMRASSSPTVVLPTTGTANNALPSSIVNDLEYSLQFRLVNCWLSSFRLSDLTYEGTKMVQLDATFYADDIQQEAKSNQ